MNENNLKKWNIILSKGRKNYVIKYGVLGWGIPTGLVLTIYHYIKIKPSNFILFIFESRYELIVFPIMGIFFGLFMFRSMKNRISKLNHKDQK